MEARIKRAMAQRIYLTGRPARDQFAVAGLTSNYLVYMNNHTYETCAHFCSCPDFTNRHQACKHIFFVLFRVLGIPQDAWLRDPTMRVDLDRPVLEQKAAADDPPAGPRPLETPDAECVVCFERFADTAQEPNTTCASCRHTFHASCVDVWRTHTRKTTCPMCQRAMH